MKVLFVGFYGVMNAGDDLLQYSLSWLFREHHLTFSRWLPAQDSIQQFDLLVIGGGSIWPRSSFFELGDEYAKSLRIPFMVLGISARSFDVNVARKTRPLIEKSVLFSVRDRQTAMWLDHPSVHLGTDLFWTAPWCGDVEAAQVPNEGIALATRSDALKEWPISGLTASLQPLGPVHGWPFFYGDPRYDHSVLNDFDALRSAMDNVPESFSLMPLRRSRLAYSMRYHGLLCAVRTGRPVLIGNVAEKLGGFCEQHGLESWQVDNIDMLRRAAREMADNYSSERARALTLRKQLLGEGESLASLIRARTAAIPLRKRSHTRELIISGIRSVLSKIS